MRINLFAILLATVAFAQQIPTKFEVATIKPNSAGDNRVMIRMAPGGGFSATGIPLRLLIMQAYDVRDFQIIGGPSWVGSERYDVNAKAGEGAPDRLTPEQMRPMLQALLEERFGLKLRKEEKEFPTYSLVQGKGGHKMKEGEKPQQGANRMMRMGRGQINAQGVDMKGFVQMLSNMTGRAVTDNTGLTGNYDVELNWTPEPGQGMMGMGGAPPPPPGAGGPPPSHVGDSSGPSLFTAVQEQLGLKLESTKGPMPVYVIESISKPTEN